MRADGFPLIDGNGPCRRVPSDHAYEGYSIASRGGLLAGEAAAASASAAMVTATATATVVHRRLLLVTTTYASRTQLQMLHNLAHGTLINVTFLLWIVVEDAAVTSEAVGKLLQATGIPTVHMAVGPTRRKGHEQRNVAYEYIRDHKLEGVVYNADDDNE